MSGMDRLTEPLPCPFCGMHPMQKEPGLNYRHPQNVRCYLGEMVILIDGIAAWNRRASQAAPVPVAWRGKHFHPEASAWIYKDGPEKPATAFGSIGQLEPLYAAPAPFQDRVDPWMQACFGAEVSADKLERGDRLLEEVLELLQSGDYPSERVAMLTSYVWSRDIGEPAQEVGGVMVTLAAYCLAHGLNMHDAGETELARIWTKVEKIRAKQAAKPKGSALPQVWAAPAPSDALREAARTLLDGAETGSLAELHHAVSDLFGVVDGSDQEDDLFEALLEGLRHTGSRAALSTPTEER